jgi:hypothetical protein
VGIRLLAWLTTHCQTRLFVAPSQPTDCFRVLCRERAS